MQPNILFLTIDGLRADKCHGNYKTSKTIHIDSLIKNGTYFDQAVPSADGTILSLNSLFNALYPFKTGTRTQKLILKDTNYIQALKDSDYHIYGLIPELISFSAFARYCENEDMKYKRGPPAEPIFELSKKIVNMLESKKMKEPWFYYIHIFDLHWPLTVPSEFNNEKFGHSPYEKIVSSIDFWLGKILEKIDMKYTLLVLTSDHGAFIPVSNKGITDFEPDLDLGLKIGKNITPKFIHPFGAKLFIFLRSIIKKTRLAKANRNLTPYEKRSRLPHFTISLYDESIRVPLLFTGWKIPHKIISQQVRSIDIFPTIAELIGLPNKQENIDGRSLVPLLEGKNLDDLPVYIRSMPHEKISSDDVVGIRTSKYKYFRGVQDPNKKIHLYDLRNDPQENNNIAKIYPDIVNKLEKILTEITSETYFSVSKEVELTEEETRKIEEELVKLGYRKPT